MVSTVNLIGDIGCDFYATITCFQDSANKIPVDLTGGSAVMKIKANPSDPTSLVSITPVCGGTAGTITIHIPASSMTQPALNINRIQPDNIKSLSDNMGTTGFGPCAYWDLLVTFSDGSVNKLASGQFCFNYTVSI
jgi:hypothetical protein